MSRATILVSAVLLCVYYTHFAAAVCGDGVVEPNELCDTGVVGGVGCSAACVTTPTYYCAGSPSVCTLSFQIVTTASAALTVSSVTFPDSAALASAIVTAANNPSVVLQPVIGTITSLGPNLYSVPFNLAFQAQNAGAIPAITANLQRQGAFTGAFAGTSIRFNNNCGNGLVELGEACDDGATNNGCTNCVPEPNFICTAALVSDTLAGGIVQQRQVCTLCGNSQLNANVNEKCDDGNFLGGDGCKNCVLEAVVPVQACGNGVLEGFEQCDDRNLIANDGCTGCTVDPGFTCNGQPSICTRILVPVAVSVCGNRIREVNEGCDDGNLISGDGCANFCAVEAGFICTGTIGFLSVCTRQIASTCGNGITELPETCDDANAIAGDGCTNCVQDIGFNCITTSIPTVCVRLLPVCGDGVKSSLELCDDGNLVSGDGCSNNCIIEAGFSCNLVLGKSVCALLAVPALPGLNFNFDDSDDDSDELLLWLLLLIIPCLLLSALLACLRKKRVPIEDAVFIPPPPPPVAAPIAKPAPFIVHPAPETPPAVVYEVYDTYDDQIYG